MARAAALTTIMTPLSSAALELPASDALAFTIDSEFTFELTTATQLPIDARDNNNVNASKKDSNRNAQE